MDDDSLGLEVVQTYRCAVCAKVLWVTPCRSKLSFSRCINVTAAQYTDSTCKDF